MMRLLLASLLAFSAFAQKPMFHNCPPEGTWKTEEDKALNTLKNRWQAPTQVKKVELSAVVAPVNKARDGADDSGRFQNTQGATIEGFIVAVKFEGAEGCNCESTAPTERDFHIWFGLTPDAPKRECMIVEIAPRWREAMRWTPDEIKGWKGHRVRVTGWFFFDPRHASMAVNSTPGAKVLARATCWELHPVTALEVLP